MKNFQKYYSLLQERIDSTFRQWESRESIIEKEIYFFLHNLKGTAGSIGVHHIADIATEKINSVSEHSETEWTHEKWLEFLKELQDVNVQQSEVPAPPTPPTLAQTANPIFEDKVILIIDQDIDFVTSIKEKLESNGFHVIIGFNIDKGTELFYTMKPQFVMIDINIGQSFGTDLLEQMIAVAKTSFTPIAIISNQHTIENRILSFNIGANDFISKPIQQELLIPYINNRMKTQQHIQNSITIDELTGAYNRRYMNDMLEKAIKTFNRHQHIFSVAMIDLDHFKQINDQYGHLVGDEVLKALVSTIQKQKRETDYLFRFGGEEFLIYLPHTTAEDGKILLERILSAFSSQEFRHESDRFHVTFSAGIATVNEQNNDMAILLEQADEALYDSKIAGRNQVKLYSEKKKFSMIKKLNFIVVDDDKMVRTVLERSLTKMEFDHNVAVIVQSFEDGIQFLESKWYNAAEKYIILLDGMMPKMDGIEVLTKVRADYPDQNIVISMLSARSSEKNIVQALEKGADDYLLKPFNIPELMARLHRLAKRMLL